MPFLLGPTWKGRGTITDKKEENISSLPLNSNGLRYLCSQLSSISCSATT